MMFFFEFFLLVGVYLLVLVSFGLDFLLLLWGSLCYGWGYGLVVLFGIVLVNGFYIVLVIGGFSFLQCVLLLLVVMQWLVVFYLVWLGWVFWCVGWYLVVLFVVFVLVVRVVLLVVLGIGFFLVVFNFKNGVFYFGLFIVIVLVQIGVLIKFFYGVWMFGVVLVWDVGLVYFIVQQCVMWVFMCVLLFIEWGVGLLLMFVVVVLVVSCSQVW